MGLLDDTTHQQYYQGNDLLNTNILVTSAGVMSAINIIKSLKIQQEIKINIIATDSDPYAPGLHLADIYYISPPIKKKNEYLEFLFNIIKKHEKTTKEKKGGIISKENLIHLSNLKNLDNKDKINKAEGKK